jgi:uncharacterized membrane protein YeaQ/YmgE (transglycosylase-associated protein family)
VRRATARRDRYETPLAADNRKARIMIGLIVTLVIVGLIAGALARLLVPGKQSMSILATMLLGIVGSFVGGFLGYLIFHKDASQGFFQPAGLIGSIIGAVIVLLIWSRVGSRGGAGRVR